MAAARPRGRGGFSQRLEATLPVAVESKEEDVPGAASTAVSRAVARARLQYREEGERPPAEVGGDRSLPTRSGGPARHQPEPPGPAVQRSADGPAAHSGSRWFRVAYYPRVAVRCEPSLEAVSVSFLPAGEVVEVVEMKQCWAMLSDSERRARDISKDCPAWVLFDGREVGLGDLLKPFEPRWFRVIWKPKVVARSAPDSSAVVICGLKAGEVFEVEEIRDGWAALAKSERASRDVSADCSAWCLIDGYDKGMGRLLEVCPPPEHLRGQEDEDAADKAVIELQAAGRGDRAPLGVTDGSIRQR